MDARRRRIPAVCAAIVVALMMTTPVRTNGPVGAGDAVAPSALKAAFLFNFVKFTEWPDVAAGDPFAICVLGDDRVAGALTELTRGQKVDTHPIEIRPLISATASRCHVLFVSEHAADGAQALQGCRDAATLTVGDAAHFADMAGMIEFFVERDRMRFAINVTAAQRAHLKLSSRLLGLARIVRDDGAR
jgi:uncharacterized protein DUF4154